MSSIMCSFNYLFPHLTNKCLLHLLFVVDYIGCGYGCGHECLKFVDILH